MHIPLNQQITTRDGTLAKDSKSVNMLGFEKRPGLQVSLNGSPGAGNGVVCYGGAPLSIVGGNMTDNSAQTITGWTQEPQATNYNGVVAGATSAVAYRSTAVAVIYSTDGITWQNSNLSASIASMTYGNGIFVGISGTTTYTSVDGNTWTTHAGGPTLYYVGFQNGIFVGIAGMNAVYTSTDGFTWVLHTQSFLGSGFLGGVFAGNGKFVLVTQAVSPNMAWAYSSTDGVNWTRGNQPFPTNDYYWFPFPLPNGGWGAISYSSGLSGATSSDGSNWTLSNPAISAPFALSHVPASATGGGMALVCCSGSVTGAEKYLTTADGVNFVSGSLPVANIGTYGLCYFNNAFLVAPYLNNNIDRSNGFATVTTQLPISSGLFDIISPCSGNALIKSTSTLYGYSGGTLTQVPQSIVSAAVTAGGTGGTAGTYTLGISGGGGTGAAGTYTIAGGSVSSINITAGGTGYYAAPTLSFPSGGVTGATGAAVLNAYPATTVPGLVQLDGTVYVMDVKGNIYGSNLGDFKTWNPLNVIQANADTDCGVAICRHLNYLVAFKSRSVEFFYDAGNPTGSPLSRAASAYNEIGCAAAGSVVATENQVFFMSKTLERGRAISVITGTSIETISNPYINKILNNDSLATVYSFSMKVAGHTAYVLTLKASNITIAYIASMQQWVQLTSSVAKAPLTASSLTQANGIATAVFAAPHNFADGDPVTFAGATPAGYNGRSPVTYVDQYTVTYPVDPGLAATATGTITATGYTLSYFTYVSYTACSGKDLLQHESNGKVYEMLPSVYQDDGLPIDCQIITPNLSAEDSSDLKRVAFAEVIGDKVASTIYLRYTDSDYSNWSPYRPINMAYDRSRLVRLGATRRRAYQLRHTDNAPMRLNSLLLTMK